MKKQKSNNIKFPNNKDLRLSLMPAGRFEILKLMVGIYPSSPDRFLRFDY